MGLLGLLAFAGVLLAAGCGAQVVSARAPSELSPVVLARAEAVDHASGRVAWYSARLREAFAAADVPTGEFCPSGFWTVQDGELFVDQLVGAYGGTVWHDSGVGVQCGGQSLEITMTPDQLRRVASHPGMLEELGRFSPRRAGQLAEALEIHGLHPAGRATRQASSGAATPAF
jgi:hypothetical protein